MKTKLVGWVVCTALYLSASSLRAQDLAPASVVGRTAVVVITAGTGIFATSGAYKLVLGASTYQVVPITPSIFPSSGTYTWTKTGPGLATTVIINAQTGIPANQSIAFSTPTTGLFSTTSAVGTQTGTFIWEGVPEPSPPRLINLSVLTSVQTGGVGLMAGFVVGGSSPKTVLIRAIGPSLTSFGITNPMPDPNVNLFNASNVVIAANGNWQSADAPTMARVGAFQLPLGSLDAALVVTLNPGNYTVQAIGAGALGGSVLIEVYEVQ